MKGMDRFLWAIVIGTLLLVALTFVVVLGQPSAEYRPDESPGDIAHNYLLALVNEDYERAYSYLSPQIEGYPESLALFRRDIERFSRFNLESESLALSVGEAEIIGDQAFVEIKETRFYRGGLFDSNQYTYDVRITLEQLDGDWKVVDAENHFPWCWRDSAGCQ